MISSTVVASSHRVRNLNPRCLHFSPRTAHLQAAPAHPLMVKPALQFYTNSGRKTSSSCSYTNTQHSRGECSLPVNHSAFPDYIPLPVHTVSAICVCLSELTTPSQRVNTPWRRGALTGDGNMMVSVCVPQETAIHKHTALLQREHFQS